VVAHDNDNLGVQASFIDRVDERLHIAASSRYQYRNA